MQVLAGKSKFHAAGLLQVGSTGSPDSRAPRPLLSVREAARLLGVCAATVYKLCGDGELPYKRILSAIRIVPVDLAAFVVAKRTR
jgi:excisionase family DNA binding protein